MSVQRLKVDDVVLFHQSNDASSQTLGLIRYIGLMYGSDVMTQYVGIELMEPIRNGHGGTIKGYSYFNTEIGYGTHCLLRNVIKRLRTSEMFSICKSKLKATKSNKDPAAKHNRNNINTPTSQESDKFSDKRSSILSDFDMFAPMTPFSPRNSLLSQKSQKKSALHGKSIRMLKPRQSLSTPIAFPDTEPVAVIISEEQETKTERSKKRRKKKHKKTKKKRKRRQPKRKLERINSNEANDMPAFGAHSKSAPEHIADNKYVFQPQQPVQNQLYVPQIPYSHSASNSVSDLETMGYENDARAQYQSHDNKQHKYNAMHAMMPHQYEHNQSIKSNLYVPQIPYSHSASHSVMNLEDMAQIQPRKNHLYAPPNAFAMAGFSHNRSSSVPALDMQSTSAPEISKRVHYEQPKNTTHGNGNNEQFTSYKQYLYEPINNIEAKLKQLQRENSSNNFRFIGCH